MLKKLLITAALLSSTYGADVEFSRVADEYVETMAPCYGVPINTIFWQTLKTPERSITIQSSMVLRITKQVSLYGQLPNIKAEQSHEEYKHEETIYGQLLLLPAERTSLDSEGSSLPIKLFFQFTPITSGGQKPILRTIYAVKISSNNGGVSVNPNTLLESHTSSNTVLLDCILNRFSFKESEDTYYSLEEPLTLSILHSIIHRPITFSLLLRFMLTDDIFHVTDSIVTNECSINFEETIRHLPSGVPTQMSTSTHCGFIGLSSR